MTTTFTSFGGTQMTTTFRSTRVYENEGKRSKLLEVSVNRHNEKVGLFIALSETSHARKDYVNIRTLKLSLEEAPIVISAIEECLKVAKRQKAG